MAMTVRREYGFKGTHSCAIVNAITAQQKGIKPAVYAIKGRLSRKDVRTKRVKPKYTPLFNRQVTSVENIWPQFLDSIGAVGAKRLNKIARDQLATNISQLSLAFLKRSGVPMDRLTRYFVVCGVDARVPLDSMPSDNLLATAQDL
jgi:hypothetical protein